jgi:hypothetical protein
MTEISIDTERARMGDAEKWMAGETRRQGDEEKGRNGDEIINPKEKVIKISALRCHPLTGS